MPPLASANLLDAFHAQLIDQLLSRFCDSLDRNGDLIDLDPAWIGDPLRRKGLYFFDSMMGRVIEEGAYEAQSLMVGDMGGGLLVKGLAIEVLRYVNSVKKRA